MNDSALQRRIKKHIYSQPQQVRLEAAPGWDSVLEAEVREVLEDWSLPSKFKPRLERDAEGLCLQNLDFRNLIELPLRLLTAADLLWPIHSRHVGSFAELLHCYEQLDWPLYLPEGASLQLKVKSYRSKLFHETKLHELIAEQVLKHGMLEAKSPFQLYCEQRENRHTVFLSLAGEPLYRRQYKALQQHAAPLQEHLAAAALRWFFGLEQQQKAQWQPDMVYVPFAGSGTFYMEYLMLLGQVPSFRWRLPNFAVGQLQCLPDASWKQIVKRLEERSHTMAAAPTMLLLEKEAEVHQILQGNVDFFLQGAGQALAVERPLMVCADAFGQRLPDTAHKIFLPLNPPYGLRLLQGEVQAAAYYRQLGGWLRGLPRKNQEIRGFILVPEPESERALLAALPDKAVMAVQSFSQGGQHIRSVAFGLGTGTVG